MATLKIKLRGQDFTQYSIGEDSGFDYYKHDRTYSVSSPLRSDVPEHTLEISDDQIVELDFTDDTVWIGDNETLSQLFPLHYKRGALQNELILPDELVSDEQDRSLIKKAGIKLFKVFSKKRIKPAIRELAIKVENRQLLYDKESFESVGPGVLLRCSEDFTLARAENIDISAKHLLFLHGTGSSTCGSFMDLMGSKEWPSILEAYGSGHLLAFQHRTLTCSPLENALELLDALPEDIELDLVSHSRGGLVADILARFCTEGQGPKRFDDDELKIFKDFKRTKDLQIIEDIIGIIKTKKIKINNVVRVACPANGTTLASSRLNFYLNVTFNLIGLATGQQGNPIYTAFKELIMAAVENKDDADILPGLESMNPESPFIKALNNPGSRLQVSSPLFIVGGSSELSLQWKSLIVLTGKFFFRDKNDLVVDTESMKWGALRAEGKTSVYIEKSGQIDHIRYFKSPNTCAAILRALLFDRLRLPKDFVTFHRPILNGKEMDLPGETRGALGLDAGSFVSNDKIEGKRPIAILLPGIMGSNLVNARNKLWINYWNFVRGNLVQLAYTEDNNPDILADSLVATSYRKLGNYLNRDYDLVTFAFDWRRSLEESAARLNEQIIELLKFNQPIKIIGHSMGGVLVRDFIIRYPDTWKALNELPGFKTLFLGSPLGGSYRIPYVLFGQDEMIRLLGKIDIKRSAKSLLNIFCNMPGILNLLPINRDGKHDFSNRGFWESLRTAYGDESWPIPDRKSLERFGSYQKLVLEREKDIDYTNIIYIAGQSRVKKSTVSSLDIRDGKLVFDYTNKGDESVTWESGIPQKLVDSKQFYYTNVTHGSLSNETKLFAAISEILIYGATTKLQNSLPQLRGTEENFIPKETEIFDLSHENVVNTLLGLSEDDERWHKELPVEVTVTNGNLKFAKFPVLAGHYEVDAILKSEKVIDEQLDGELSRLRQLGLYPGGIGSNQIVLSPPTSGKDFKGAVIVGLGVPGELTGFLLTQSIEKGISRYLTICNNSYGNGENLDRLEGPSGISVIAIANSYGGLSTDSSIRSIILGIQKANRNIHTTYQGKIRGIEEIEIIEIYHDRALAILKAVKRLEMDDSREFNITYKGKGLNKTIGRQQRIPFDNYEDWWTRIRVTLDKDKSERQENQKIKMSITTAGASEKMESLRTNSKSLDILLEEMTDRNQFSPDIAKTMFELLIPLNFKEELKRQSNISWVLDKSTATYPWEMMQEDMDAMPLCIHSGMVRQLATNYYRRNSSTVNEMNAFIVADPDLEGYMGQLSGAKREGEEVTDILRQQNYETVSLIGSNPSQILLKLFTQHYKIIHLAGHGIFSPDPSRPTGMVIGHNAFLSVNEIAQMSTVPELVFVNCCYLGKLDSQAEEENNTRHKLAANIGTQLIENGVKAVIVAGWAVDDEAALEFCRHFYRCMFEGSGFGDAVKSARKRIYENFRFRTNTWGAFQCYGDPFYKLNNEIKDAHPSATFLIQEDIEIELQNLVHRMECNDYDADEVLTRVQVLERYMSHTGLEADNISELLANVYAGLELYEEATAHYQRLIDSGNGGFSFRAMEKGCNIRSKNIVKRYTLGKDPKDKALEQINEIIIDLETIMRFGKNAERLCILGSAYKRKLIILSEEKSSSNKAEMIETLEKAITAYRDASKLKNHKDPYPFNNYLQLLHIGKLSQEEEPSDVSQQEETIQLLSKLDGELNAPEKLKQEFWDLVNKSNILLTQMMMGLNKVNKKIVLESYAKHWRLGGHRGHKASEIEHLDILLLALNVVPASKNKVLKSNLKNLRSELLKI